MGKKDKKYDPPFDADIEDYDSFENFPEEGAHDPYADPDMMPGGRRRGRRRRIGAGHAKKVRGAEAVPEVEQTPAETETPRRRRRSFWRSMGMLVTGGFLPRPEMRKAYPFLLVVAFIMSMYVWNVLSMQNLAHRTHQLNKEIKDLRIRSNTITAIKMRHTQRDTVIARVRSKGLGLEEAVAPDTVIIITK